MPSVTPIYEPRFHIVLHQPEIPPNTGAVGRTCVALRAKLWLVRPLGFRIDERTLKRAGLDYWQYLNWEVADTWEDLLERAAQSRLGATGSPRLPQQQKTIRSVPEDTSQRSPSLIPSDSCQKTPPLVRGDRGESIGATSDIEPRRFWMFTKTASRHYTSVEFQIGDWLVFGSETAGLPPSLTADSERTLRIPMFENVRSLNLASAVAVAGYEVHRQLEQ